MTSPVVWLQSLFQTAKLLRVSIISGLWLSKGLSQVQRPQLSVGARKTSIIFSTNTIARTCGAKSNGSIALIMYFSTGLSTVGLLAFLLYISLYLLSLWYIWKSSLSTAEKSIFTGLLAGYAVHNMFVFDNLASYFLFFLVLAFVYTLRESKGFAWLEKLNKNDEVANYVILPFAAILFVVVLYFINIRPIEANTDLIAALDGLFWPTIGSAFRTALAKSSRCQHLCGKSGDS